MTNKITLKVQKQPNCSELLKYQTHGAAAMDFYAAIERSITLKPFERALVPTGIKIESHEN